MALTSADGLKEPTHSNHARDRVQTQIGTVDAGAGQVEVTGFRSDREVFPNEPVQASGALQVEFKRAA